MKERLDKRTEDKLIQIGRKKYITAIVLTTLWFVLVIFAWIYLTDKFNRSLTEPSSFVYPLLLVLPFYPFRVYELFKTKTFYGEITTAKYGRRVRATGDFMTWKQANSMEEQFAEIVVMGDSGKSFATKYKKGSILHDEIFYKPGDRVFVVRGLKYPIKCPIPKDEEYICPSCGNFVHAGRRRCSWCKTDWGK
ncbi:MAG: hypothetical protein J6L71_02625 [Clostridia bacterium]|nr:hypothetical protein [Clostridia bacterium]